MTGCTRSAAGPRISPNQGRRSRGCSGYAFRLAPFLLLAACTPSERLGRAYVDITNGTADLGDPAVVAIATADGQLRCTGSLIGAHTVLTAAHCMIGPYDGDRVFFGSSLAGGGILVEVSDARSHPRFDPQSDRNDLALLTIRSAGPAPPLALDPRTLDATVVGQTFQAVGFGVSRAGASDQGQKRAGTAQVVALADVGFTTQPAPSQPCAFDSGGPALFASGGASAVTGVTSHGDAACSDHAVYARVDVAQAEFIQPYLAATAPGSAGVGERCFYDEQCRGGPCLTTTDEPRLAFCSQPCRSGSDCPTTMTCARDGCRYPPPSPGAIGSPCAEAGQCVSGVCYREPGGARGLCTQRCTPTAPSCPPGFACQLVGGVDYDCLPEPSSGCAMAPARASPACAIGGGLLMLLLVRPSGRARRRQREAAVGRRGRLAHRW